MLYGLALNIILMHMQLSNLDKGISNIGTNKQNSL